MNKDWLTYSEQLERREWHKKRDEILKRDSHKCQMCGTYGLEDNPLNIHHRYYIYQRYAWVYDNSALITLCSHCHRLVHETLAPLIYLEKDGDLQVMDFTPCYRCNGAGYFPEYKRIESGVCFRCRGARYEELITNKQVKVSDYITNKYVFDVKSLTLDDKLILYYYDEATRYHSGKQSSLTTPNEAKSFYYKAAINGYAQAQNNLGVIYKNGFGNIQIDFEKALRWFIYSAMQGIHQAKRNIAEMYERNIGVDKNMPLSIRWEMLTWNRNDNDAINYALRRILDKSESINIKNLYLRRIYRLANKGNDKAKNIVSKIDPILKKYKL